MERTYSVAELAKEFGVTPRVVRYYEKEKLMEMPTSHVGIVEVYTPSQRNKLAMIVRCKRLGFSLAEIRELQSMGEGEPQMRELLRRTRAHIRDLEGHMKVLREKLVDFCEIENAIALELGNA